MRLSYLLFWGILLAAYGPIQAQPEPIPSDLMNLYQLTLSKSPSLQRQHILSRSAKAARQSATGLFDYQLFSDLSLNRAGNNLFDADPRRDIVGDQLRTNDFQLSTGVQRTFRSGLTASMSVDYYRIADNFPINAFNENVGAYISDNTTSTTLSVAQPLLRGRGTSVVTANERAADIRMEGQLYNTSFVTSGELYNMALGYWQYLGASRAMEIYQDNQSRVEKVLEITTELVKAEKKPTGDLLQIQADLQDKERQTIQAGQQLYTARQNLGRLIGLNSMESEQLSAPLNDFPEVGEPGTGMDLPGLLEIARRHRADLKALYKSLEALAVYVEVAENGIRPKLDLNGYMSYGGANAGNGVDRFFRALSQREGRNYSMGVGLSFLLPVNNNRAEAELLNNQLQYSDQEIQLQNQIRNIELNVGIAYNNYQNSIEALKKSKTALTYYEQVFENEQFKFQTGLTTLLNLILLQERLTLAQLDYIQNQQRFAMAISELRYETGTLYTMDKVMSDTQPVGPEIFYTLPARE